MIYIYDILLNWFAGEKIVDFFEWELNDELEHIKKIPLFKVDSCCIKDLYHSHIQVNKDFLKRIEDKTETYFQNTIETISHACLVSDGNKCVAIEFNDAGESIYKSTLLLDEEEEVLDMVEELTITIIDYKIKSTQSFEHYLTRKEFKNKDFILEQLSIIWKQQDVAKLQYLYEEYFNDKLSSFEEMYQKLTASVYDHYSKKHEEMLSILRLSPSHRSS